MVCPLTDKTVNSLKLGRNNQPTTFHDWLSLTFTGINWETRLLWLNIDMKKYTLILRFFAFFPMSSIQKLVTEKTIELN